jgi:sugar O-acyltransferase (sialic acid O-acetyltransferase NeuD family)
MKLLILGAGGHGKIVAEIAEDLGYDEIAFLDDNNLKAIGKINEVEKFRGQYEQAFIAIGNNRLRSELMVKLKECGYIIPTLIHPSAYVSRTTSIGIGTLIEPKAIINARCQIDEGCIISVGAVIDHDANIGAFSHINAGAIVKSGWTIESERKVETGEIVQGYKPSMVKSDKNKEPFEMEYLRMMGREVSFF